MPPKITTTLEDIDGSFGRFFKAAPKEVRELLKGTVKTAAFGLGQRMKAAAPRSDPEFAPHIQDQIDVKARGLAARVGLLDAGPTGTEADVALFNEYTPNKQPFMRPAAEAEAPEFKRAVQMALKKLERQLGGFGGGLR